MRLRKFRARNLGPFADFVIDLEALSEDARLVAVTGGNGAGKSTFLELFTGGALYRKCETRGSLMDLATARDAELEVSFVNGASWTVRHAVDAVSGKGESVVIGADGEPAYGSTKVCDFAAWSVEHLPPPEILYSSLVAVQQGAGGFLDAKPGERKAILLRSLGTERLERLSADARERSRAAQTMVDTLAARIADERARAGDVDETRAVLATAQEAAAVAEQELVAAQVELEAVKEAKVKAEAQQEAYLRALGEHDRLTSELVEARERLSSIEVRIRNNRAVLTEAGTIRAAVERIAELEAKAAQAQQEAAAAEQEAESTWGDARRHDAASITALARVTAAQERARRAGSRAQEFDSVREAAQQLPALRQAAVEATEAREAASAHLDELRGRRLAGAEERIGGLRGSLDQIRLEAPHGLTGEHAGQLASEALSEDNERVRLAEETPRLIKEAAQALGSAAERAQKADHTLRRAEALSARLQDVEAAVLELQTAKEDAELATEEATEHRDKAREATARAEGITGQARASQARAKDLLAEADGLRPTAVKLKHLDQAEAKLEAYAPQAAELRATVDRLQTELDDTPEPTRPSEPPSIAGSTAALREAEGCHRAALAAVTRAEEAHHRATDGVQRIAGLEQELAVAGAELADWSRLGKDLGRDGLQAVLIDSACGELTAISNDLLHEAFGPRWTVSFETKRSDAKGKRMLEDMIVRVIDTVRGRDAPAETYSGGEKTILGEAVSLALSTLACRRSGVDRPTLVRDESGAALDANKAVAYVAMLRRAVDMIGADRVLLVSHSTEVQTLCDDWIPLPG